MKAAKSDTTRWSCRLVRIGRLVLGQAEDKSAFGSRHIASCAECQRFFAAGAGLEAALRRDASRSQVAPAGLNERIMREIDRSARPPQTRQVRLALLALAGAAAAVAIGFGLWQKSNSSAFPNNDDASHHPAAVISESPVTPPWMALRPSVDALMQQDPLQNEVDSVYADARSAVHFLALNFLPSAPATPGHKGKTSPNGRAVGG